MSWMTPISLLTNITDTTLVSGRNAASKRAEVEQAVGRDVEIRDFEAFALELAHRVERRLVLGLDRDEVLALVLVEVRGALEARLIDSVAPDVHTSSFGSQLTSAATSRARLLDGRLGFPAERVRPRRRVAEVLGQVRNHLLRQRADRPAWSPSSRDRSGRRMANFGTRVFRRWSAGSCGSAGLRVDRRQRAAGGRAARRPRPCAGPAGGPAPPA